MTFLWAPMLFLLVLVPIGIGFYYSQQQRRREILERFGQMGFGAPAAGQKPGLRRHLPAVFFLAGLIILIVALARPQTVVALPKEQGTVILAFDVSGSMAADDLKPTRMAAAKAAAKDFIQRQPDTVQVGVVGFSDNGFSVQQPTTDPAELTAAIDRLSPQRGTSLANGIIASLNTIAALNQPETRQYSSLAPTPAPSVTPVPRGSYTSAVIILLSDGENNESPDPLSAAQAAADRGIRIYTVGIGSPAGTTVNINGFKIHTQLDEETLQQIAQITGGAYFSADNTKDLVSIYDHLPPQLIHKPETMEVTSIFAGASILALLAGGFFSLLWFGRIP